MGPFSPYPVSNVPIRILQKTSQIMTTHALSLAYRLREVLLDGHWIANTNFRDLIEDLNLDQANMRINQLNSIALLTYHISYYLAGLLQVLRGGTLDIRDKYSFDLPPLQSEEEWQTLVKTFISNASKFAEAVENMPENQLVTPFVDPKYGTYLRNIEGVIEHSYYHLGQVALIKKMVKEGKINSAI